MFDNVLTKVFEFLLKVIIGCYCVYYLLVGVDFVQKYEYTCTNYEVVRSVGGCDAFGDCGISTASGKSITASYPVHGETICTDHSLIAKNQHAPWDN